MVLAPKLRGYGRRSNPELLAAFGFADPPFVEPFWSLRIFTQAQTWGFSARSEHMLAMWVTERCIVWRTYRRQIPHAVYKAQNSGRHLASGHMLACRRWVRNTTPRWTSRTWRSICVWPRHGSAVYQSDLGLHGFSGKLS